MPSSSGPKLPNRNNLLFTKQPGATTIFDTNVTTSFAPDVATPSRGAVVGPRRTTNAGYGNAYEDFNTSGVGSTMEIKNIPGSIYTINTAATTIYTISLWIKIVSFPTKYNNTKASKPPPIGTASTLTTRSKRAALARFNFSNSSNINQRGWIEFGAMAPYYRNFANVENYKSIFSPISFGAAIVGPKRIYTVYTDYKFNLNQWYLVTLQLESTNFSTLTNNTITAKMFINDTQENIAQCLGIAWRSSHNRPTPRNKRPDGFVAGQPGFYNVNTGGTISNASSQTFLYKYFPNLTNLNEISYSPLKSFGGIGNNDNQNNGTNQPAITSGGPNGGYQRGSGINFGQTYIYNTAFNSNIYTQFKTLYN